MRIVPLRPHALSCLVRDAILLPVIRDGRGQIAMARPRRLVSR